jgi:hypothetical protein
MNQTKFQIKTQSPTLRFRILEEAREAVTKLSTLKPFLSPQDKETLVVLMDKELTAHLEKSLTEVDEGKFEPLENILK